MQANPVAALEWQPLMHRSHAASILSDLAAVDHERRRRTQASALGQRVQAVKVYQQERFRKTYADLLAAPDTSAAARFFLDELYGPADFTRRDAQFARVVPALVRLFSDEIVGTVATLASLHALSEVLDTRIAAALASQDVDAAGYAAAWRDAGTPAERERQIALTLAVGSDLDRLTRKPLLRHTLRLMRGPAQAAGLEALQRFLESGFDTFRAMRQASAFLATIGTRERALADALFAADPAAVLGQLP